MFADLRPAVCLGGGGGGATGFTQAVEFPQVQASVLK